MEALPLTRWSQRRHGNSARLSSVNRVDADADLHRCRKALSSSAHLLGFRYA